MYRLLEYELSLLVAVAQLGRALLCESSCRGFEPRQSPMYYVYILQSVGDKSLYTGVTHDLKKRFQEHNDGLSNYTNKHRPYNLIYYEAYSNKLDAMQREKFLKSGRGREVVKKQLLYTLSGCAPQPTL